MKQIETYCGVCRKTTTVEVPEDGYNRWQAGELLQNALPDVPAAVREQLLTGIDGECWTKLFADDEEFEEMSDRGEEVR